MYNEIKCGDQALLEQDAVWVPMLSKLFWTVSTLPGAVQVGESIVLTADDGTQYAGTVQASRNWQVERFAFWEHRIAVLLADEGRVIVWDSVRSTGQFYIGVIVKEIP